MVKNFKVYSDPGFTGANLERPGLQTMLKDIRDPGYLPSANSGMTGGGPSSSRHNSKGDDGIKFVIVYKMDRLTLSLKDFYLLLKSNNFESDRLKPLAILSTVFKFGQVGF